MNTQTLNRMIKASYSAPNGAQLRKACYGLLSVNSRRASENPAVALEQIEQLPKQEQAQVKTEIISKALISESKKDQAKLAPYGLNDVKKFMAQNQLTPNIIQKEAIQADPMLKKSIESQVSSPKDAVSLASTVIKARTFEEIAAYLDIPLDWLQSKIEDIKYFKIIVICFTLYMLLAIIVGTLVEDASFVSWLLNSILVVAGIKGFSLVIYYYFGNVMDWIEKRFGILMGWVVLILPRAFVRILTGIGTIVDTVLLDIKGAFNKFFSRQAKIAMQSPEFRRAYYSI